MGAVGHRQFIRVLSVLVAVDLVVGVVGLAMRNGDGHDGPGGSRVSAGSVAVPLKGDGILAGGSFNNRRRSTGRSGTGAVQSTATTAAGTASSATTQAPPTTGAAPATTASTRGVPSSTTSTARPAPPTPSTAARPSGTTAPRRSPGTTAPPSSTTATSGPASAGGQGGTPALEDPAGDTVVDGTQKPIEEPRADILRAGALYRPDLVAFVVQVSKPVDPRQDAHWASDSTFLSWSVDTTGDGTPDFDIQYYFSDGAIGATLSRPGDNGAPVDCDVEAGYGRDGSGPEGYSVALNPGCLGNPGSIAYRVTMYYDTDPKDDNADVASDVTPNGGMSFPANRPN